MLIRRIINMSSPDSMNTSKGIEPQYHYTGPIKEEPLPEVPADSGSPMIMDQISPAAKLEPGQKTITAPPVDNPNAPIPTRKAVMLMAVRKVVQEAAVKADAARTAGNSGGDGGGGNNWLCFPNCVGALAIALMNLQITMSKSRKQEADNQLKLRTAIFACGMQNAELAKQLKDLAADKEWVKAVTSFLQVGVAMYQMGALTHTRGQVERKVYGANYEKEREWDKKSLADKKKDIADLESLPPPNEDPQLTKDIKAQKKKILDMEEVKLTESQDPNKQQDLAQTSKKVEKEKEKLSKMEKRREKQCDTRTQSATTDLELRCKAMNHLIEGFLSVYNNIITKLEGGLEKQKGINEAFQQYLSRLDDSSSKERDSATQMIDKIFQSLLQLSSEMKATLSTRG